MESDSERGKDLDQCHEHDRGAERRESRECRCCKNVEREKV